MREFKNQGSYVPLNIVDGRTPDWDAKLTTEADSRRNFVVILKSPTDLPRLCSTVDCIGLPEKLERWAIHALAEALDMRDYSLLLSLYQQFDIRLIEQLKLKRNQPPRVKPFMIYCEVRGIVSDHATGQEAGDALLNYLNDLTRAKLFPLVGLYYFANGSWIRQRKAF